jgi:putative toxin-antitoxin system antitoxin component (TIGR02293 family)
MGKPKKYPEPPIETNTVSEPAVAYTTTGTASRTIVMMGMNGRKGFEAVHSENDFISLIRTGIPKQAMDNLMDVAELSLAEMAAITHTSDRTLRRYKPQQKLSQEQSERMVELAALYTRGEEVFGSLERFREWMNSCLLPFGNKKPKDFLDTSLGIKMIIDELGRIQHGIFA